MSKLNTEIQIPGEDLFSLLQVSLPSLDDAEFWYEYHQKIARNFIWTWHFFTFEDALAKLESALKKKNEAESGNSSGSNQTVDSMMSKAKSSMPKMNMPGMKLPNFK